MYCVYLADSAATLGEHARLADLPFHKAREVRRVVDPAKLDDEG